jgi:hypothetical protein
MGKTQQPLTIWVWSEWLKRAEVQELAAKGHFVIPNPWHGDPDLILHPKCSSWDDEMWPMLEVTLKAARARKYAPKPKKEKKS